MCVCVCVHAWMCVSVCGCRVGECVYVGVCEEGASGRECECECMCVCGCECVGECVSMSVCVCVSVCVSECV